MASVSDETDLSMLHGENDEYCKLVTAKFQSKYGNVKWKAAQLMTKDEFLDGYSADEAPAVRNLLLAWMNNYKLEERFTQSPLSLPQQNGKLRCCFRIHCAGRTSIRV
jgi:hypothetical protein